MTTVPHKTTPQFRRLPTATHRFLHLTRLVACVAVMESIPVIALLVIDIGRRATPLSLCVVHGLASRNLVRFLDGVAPVGRNQSLVGIDDAERRGEAANHSTGFVWSTSFLVDALHKNKIIWSRLRELQDDLVCPLPYGVCENLVSEEPLLYVMAWTRLSNCFQNLSETGVTSMYPIRYQVISASYSCSAELKEEKN